MDDLSKLSSPVPARVPRSRERVCIVPPDYTRFHSRAGMLTQLAYKHYGDAIKDVIPALGCHEPLTEEEREDMFGIIPEELFRVHDWRNDVVTVGGYARCR